MASMTYYVVLPFVRNGEGDLVPGEAIEAQSAAAARLKAQIVAATNAGAIAFSRKGNPDLGEFEPAEILARVGETADEVD